VNWYLPLVADPVDSHPAFGRAIENEGVKMLYKFKSLVAHNNACNFLFEKKDSDNAKYIINFYPSKNRAFLLKMDSTSRGRWGHVFGSGNLTELPSAEFTIALGNYKQKAYLEDNFFPKKAEIIADFFISSFSADILFDLLPQTSHLLKNNYFS